MALFKSQVLTQASGSVGGLTYSHGKGGMYMRARATPVNPNTERQQAVRSGLAEFSQRWLQNLTAAQRDGWDEYAANVAMKNRLGDTIYLSGQNHYIRANSSRRAANQTLSLASPLGAINNAPTVFELPVITFSNVATISEASQELNFSVSGAGNWPVTDGAAMLVYMGLPRNVTRKFFKGPYRLAGAGLGDSGGPPVDPMVIPLGGTDWPVTIGQLVRVQFVLSLPAVAGLPYGLSASRFDDITVTV